MESLTEFLLQFSGPVPYLLVFAILLACGLGVPVPEDITLAAAGLLSFYNVANVGGMIATAMAGVLIGDSMIFFLGALYGRRITRRPFFAKVLRPERLNQVQKKFNEYGNQVIFAARFMPGLRAPIYFSAGTLHLPYRIFLFYDGLAALISVPTIIYCVYYFGEHVDYVLSIIKDVQTSIIVIILLVIGALVFKWYWKKRKSRQAGQLGIGFLSLIFLTAFMGGFYPAKATSEEKKTKSNGQKTQASIGEWCGRVKEEIEKYGWDKIRPCDSVEWKKRGYSVQGWPLVYQHFGNPEGKNRTLVLTMVHSDEITPLYTGLRLKSWLKKHLDDSSQKQVLLAPLVNPDGFFREEKTRVNANGVDLNRNFKTDDWKEHALEDWREKYQKNPRRYPGPSSNSEPETRFQVQLIEEFKPQKVLSVHAPLDFMDYDGPNVLNLSRFPNDYVKKCLKLRSELQAEAGGFFPGSLGNYSGQERGIPTLTLELPSASAKKAKHYWKKFQSGIEKVIDFRVPENLAKQNK